MRKLSTIFWIFLMLCWGVSTLNAQDKTADPTMFTNPMHNGADPWIVKHDGKYYTCASAGRGIVITESRFMTRTESRRVVWSPPKDSWNSYSIWAPELHFIRGKWYIYYAAGEHKGPPYTSQRTGVLECDTPMGDYKDMGMLYTGDDPEQKSDNVWAIDMTTFEHRKKLYAVWSGWKSQKNTDKTSQCTYIAQLKNPYTIGRRVLISEPDQPWEKGESFPLQEGPQILTHGDDIFIIYSTRGSWTVHYKLGQLRLASPKSDPLNPSSWIKSGPVFQGTPTVHGVGHASFAKSPDDSQYWIYYHSKKATSPGWDRDVRLQQFTFDANGNPDFKTPVDPGPALRPSGEVELER